MIQTENLHKRFRTVTALDGIGFTARDGQVTGLIGPNGAGKTTVLRIIYTVMHPDSGSARVDGLDTIANRREVQSRIGVLPDTRGLYPRLTAREHVRYFGRLHGMNGKDLERRIGALIESLDLTDFADRRAMGFSKGQVRKVALARALVHEPENLLLDEPTNGLDLASSRVVHGLIREIRDQGRCVLFCSHIMHEVVSICDHIVIIDRGRVVVQGSIQELLSRTGVDDLEDMFLSVTGGDP